MRNKAMQWRSSLALSAICLILAVVFGSCEQSVGFGNTIDFEAPTLTVTSIILPDGTKRIIEGDSSILIGQGIKVGPECILTGEAWDNVLVTGIQVEETGPNAEIINGRTRVWNNAEISPKGPDGKQTWRIALDGIQKGERNITISAFDKHQIQGLSMTRNLTLLVDTDPPFVESVRIERSPGAYVDLLSKSRLETLDPNKLEYVDYFQNTIRASIVHDFELSGVSLNFLNEQGEAVFSEGLERDSGGLTTPMWLITEEMLTGANPDYSSGRHYLQAVITAKAEAGHSGQNDVYDEDGDGLVSNELYSLCWYPEADNARIQMDEETEKILKEKGAISTERNSNIPITIFDDDTLHAVYTAIVSKADWDLFMQGETDDQKLQSLYDATEREKFPQISPVNVGSVRNTTIPVTSASERGEYRLVVLVQDTHASGRWTHRLFTVQVMEDGIPVISVTSPAENTSPVLTDGTFTLEGSVLNLDEVEFLRIAWVPDGLGLSANEQMEKGQAVLIDNAPADGIQIWDEDDIVLTRIEDRTIGTKTFKQQTFKKTFNIFTDFMYNGLENAPKLFILYTQSKGIDVFLPFRLMPYTTPPEIAVERPVNGANFGKNEEIPFEIRVKPDKTGVPIDPDSVTLISVTDNDKPIPLTRGTGENENVWTGNTAFPNEGNYYFRAAVEDELGNINQLERYVIVTTLPEFKEIASPYAEGTTFSGRDTINLQAVFSGSVNTVTGMPRLVLGGFEDDKPRYAAYKDGAGSATLNFTYPVQAGDKTTAGGLTVTKIDLKGGSISSEDDLSSIPESQLNLHVDSIVPKITSIAITGDSDEWLRAGQELKITADIDKPVRVLGNPKLKLSFNGNSREANFLNTEGQSLVFAYTVKAGDTANPVSIAANLFSEEDRKIITDTAGNNGNWLSLTENPDVTGTVYIDTKAPPALIIEDITENEGIPPIKVRIKAANVELNAKVEYTINNGTTWTSITGPYEIPGITAPGDYQVFARQTDPAGNESGLSNEISFIIGETNLAALVCDVPDGAYPAGSDFSFELLFTGKVSASVGGPTITIGRSTDDAQDITIPLAANVTNDFALNFEWNNIPSGYLWEPLVVKDINLTGVTRDDGTAPGGNIASVISEYNSSRAGIHVLSVAPSITEIHTGGDAVVDQYETIEEALDAADTKVLDNETLVLQFSQPVLPESGNITIKPAGDWLIPPVLTSDEYYEITKNLNAADITVLESAYIKTTHGLKLNGGNYVPDTAAKYVLRFDKGLDDNILRAVLERAGYLRQIIDVHSTAGSGTNEITVTMNPPLPDGRIWEVTIGDVAFIDPAGNKFAGSTVYIWSGKTAVPVIRVNRVSNNHPTTNPTGQIATANIPGTKVQYRIDSVTPDADILYETVSDNNRIAIITDDMNLASTYNIPSSMGVITDGTFISSSANSQIDDIEADALETLDITEPYTVIKTIGDDSLYTARKDYIAANAARTNLEDSDNGYEGVFKTVVVYRNVTAGNYVKFEGSNVNGGVPTIAGFPLEIEDYRTSKYAYKNTSGANTDYIWITWEIVSDFYQKGVKISNDEGPYTGASWAGDINFFIPRKYGNYGLRVGNGF